jgi:hypothetical protein
MTPTRVWRPEAFLKCQAMRVEVLETSSTSAPPGPLPKPLPLDIRFFRKRNSPWIESAM